MVVLLLQTEADVGVIDKVVLINFMCHRRLDIALSANVNFVLGRNGSKSLGGLPHSVRTEFTNMQCIGYVIGGFCPQLR